ncbi:MAG: ABC transporter permease subunit [Firmicutes bacterium]|nr:ABC transporter permease subunit [Dethiobacter sp.]MBS3887762.1 ABC transporter permease subunit [Bacillota bacterium]MBS4054799.1 ABC transporter permease subunit [Thermaerobacter sp.]
MMNLVLRELYANKKSLLIWGASMAAFVAMMLVEFAAYYKNPEMLAVIDAMPRELLAAFGMLDANLTTVSGYLSMAMVFINVTLAVYATMLGHNLVAKEERDKTAGFLMTLPLTRARVITGKLLAGALCTIILLVIVAASILGMLLPHEAEPYFLAFFSRAIITTWIIMVMFLALGTFLGALTRRHKLASGLGMGLVFALYIASIVSGLTEQMRFLRYISPFEYFEAAGLLRDRAIEPFFLVLSLVIVIVLVVGTYVCYGRRDLYV